MTIDLVTPTKKLVEGAHANALKLPSTKGELQVLPGHADMLTLLDTGVMSFVHDGRERRFAVSYGFAEVRKDKITVMAETAEEATDIDVARAQAAKQRAEKALEGTLSEEDYRKQRMKLHRAIVRQAVAAHTH